jgi:hypothetical protein
MALALPPDAMKDPAISKVISIMGRERGMQVVEDAMQHARLETLRTPDDRYAFASALMTRGGVFEAIGRSIKIQAILHGAKDR